MYIVKYSVSVILITIIIRDVQLISVKQSNGSAEILWNLTNLAIQGRQYQKGPAQFFPANQPLYNDYYNNFHNQVPNGQGSLPQYFTKMLQSIAQNDQLECIPRLLCELTSGGTSAKPVTLPFDFNAASLVSLLSTFGGLTSSPIVHFGKAALLGYTSKGDAATTCVNAYPRCPRDTDGLVNYLNNYNGGFFRYFNGVSKPTYQPTQNYQTYPQPPRYPPPYYPYKSYNPYKYYKKVQKRIQTRPLGYFPNSNAIYKYHSDINFPKEITYNKNHYYNYSPFSFPKYPDANYNYGYGKIREEKGFSFPQFNPNYNELDFQRPLPNHMVSPNIFPVRTGTGELLLDPDEANLNSHHDYYNQRDHYWGEYQSSYFRFPTRSHE